MKTSADRSPKRVVARALRASGEQRDPAPRTSARTAKLAASTRSSKAPARVREPKLADLWRTYGRKRDDATRNLLVERYQALVETIVHHFALRLPRNVDRGDLSTAANFGLMAAIESFDPARGVRFESYGERRVKGALLDELRNQDWLPRPWRARIELQKRVVENLRSLHSREPDDADVAFAMNLPLDEYCQLFGGGMLATPLSAPGPNDDEDAAPGLEVVPDRSSAAAEDRLSHEDILRLVAQRLSVQEYRLVYLKYWEELSMREIGELMSLSESRVCKMHQKLIERLKDRLGDDSDS